MSRTLLLRAVVALALTLAGGGRLFAQTPPADPKTAQTLQALQQRLDQLEKQNRELQDAVKNLQPAPSFLTPAPLPAPEVRSAVVDVLKEQAQAKADADLAAKQKAERDGTVVGEVLGLTARWTTGVGGSAYQPWFESEDKAFRFHVGGRFQPDWIFGAGADSAVENGAGGTGNFLEGSNFRRARLGADGWMYEVVDFSAEFEFSNSPFNTGVKPGNITPLLTPTGTQPISNISNNPAPTDVWVSANSLPFLGTVRVGGLKPAIGLDHLTSSRFLDFMERSSGFDTYYNRNNGWEPGFMITNWTENKRATYQASATRTSNTPYGWTQGTSSWDFCARVTCLPLYVDDGRCMIHLGLGAKYQGLDNSTGTGVAILNERWLLRNSQSNLQNVVSLAVLNGRDQTIINPEFFANFGAFSMQAEYISSQVYDVTRYSTQLTPAAINVSPRTFRSQAAYVQALYFLTGEQRPYGMTALHGSGAAPTRVVPFSNFYWLRGENGFLFAPGAWQLGARYCYSTLDDGPINGGIVNEVTLGLNWFLNPNVKFQWNYDLGHREIPGGSSSGNYYGFGMRMALDF